VTFAAVEEWLLEAGRQVPALVVLGYIVVQFLRHLSEQDKRCSENAHKASDAIKEVSVQNTEALKEVVTGMKSFQQDLTRRTEEQSSRVQESLDKNTEALGRNTEALARQGPPEVRGPQTGRK
jgi:predicted RNase H-like nuclease (RuvC/YqgF family)